ncbi:DUF4255 domain-containing protein [Streptomyces sp. NBC_01275]|uniref:Pvc16 family protein n=1 Tax=Streptomyces sp. NBC_01275 TaxID=2903807 RepID=UPI00225A5AA6|nr:Pvc16 family protein [Streptomyces sp. NBC_01275]MCX4759759.1 DUF4255 domain-containing protein [Streptomyces sp. NBC_01275]
MFQDLDATLAALLDDPAAPPALRAADISFATPDKDFRPPQPTVNLFLHALHENLDLRDQSPLVERTTGGGFVHRRPPLRVDCSYLVTVWSALAGGLKAEEEHRLLGLALLWLSGFPVIEERHLRGGLTHPPQLHAVPAQWGRAEDGTGSGQFWTALGVPPRPALTLVVTVDALLAEEPDVYPPTKEVQVKTRLR